MQETQLKPNPKFEQLKPNPKFGQLADEDSIKKAIDALKSHNFEAELVQTSQEARDKVMALIPEQSEVMTMTSKTLDETGIAKEINESGKFVSIRQKLMSDKSLSDKEKKNLAFTVDFALGSVHAITEEGQIMVASNTGSQMPAYIYGAGQVIFVVGIHKIVGNIQEGLQRIYEYSYPLEAERAMTAYGIQTAVNNIWISNKAIPGRVKIILVAEKLGF